MFVIGFNGPPGCGKDTLAQMLADHMDKQGVTLPIRQVSLSMPLRQIAYSVVGYDGQVGGQDYEDFKLHNFILNGREISGRQLMIDVSERFLKPCYGKAVMADLLMRELKGFHGIVMIRDSGFQCEIDPILEHVGQYNFALVRVHRPGCSFDGDSREWVILPTQQGMDITNNGTLNDLRTEAGRIYGRLVNRIGWALK